MFIDIFIPHISYSYISILALHYLHIWYSTLTQPLESGKFSFITDNKFSWLNVRGFLIDMKNQTEGNGFPHKLRSHKRCGHGVLNKNAAASVKIMFFVGK